MKNLEQQLTPDPDELYLQDLVIEQPKEKFGLEFDPKGDITPGDWKGVTDQLNQLRQGQRWGNFAEYAMRMKILGATPEQLRLDETAWQGMRDELNQSRQSQNWWGFASLAVCMYILSAHKAEIKDGQIVIEKYPPKAAENFSGASPLPPHRKF